MKMNTVAMRDDKLRSLIAPVFIFMPTAGLRPAAGSTLVKVSSTRNCDGAHA
jgi:hypothetical protein